MINKLPRVALIGAPNVGKSAIFNYLTGAYVTVSNYPGTTVDISRGLARINGKKYEILDTPGLYSLRPVTEEERVTVGLLNSEQPDIIVHVIDTKNIHRMLGMTLELIEAGYRVILNLNLVDEAEKAGVNINAARLADALGIPVVSTSAIYKRGLDHLKRTIYTLPKGKAGPHPVERTLDLEGVLDRQRQVDIILGAVTRFGKVRENKISTFMDEISREPVTGALILGLVLYIGLYLFVGRIGAGFLVDYINNSVFGDYLIPAVADFISTRINNSLIRDLVVGDYGIFSLGFRYAVAIILPIVGTFFLVFALLEDCGYLPRLAMLTDRIFKGLGLNGRAVIPITLGFGCGTMAVMVTRTLETKRERFLATFLLSLAIPCSAQLGVVISLLSANTTAVLIWSSYILFVFLVAGWINAQLFGSRRSLFYMELPPIRMPLLSNVFKKAYTRMGWYFVEILPVFIITSILLFIADRIGLLVKAIVLAQPIMGMIGLPIETAQAFFLGFFRRDYGAAGLYDLQTAGILTERQLLVAVIAMTLFVPCVAQFAVMVKERGLIVAAVMSAVIAGCAFLSGWLVNWGVEILCLI